MLKWQEMLRQGSNLHPLHVAALYVYTYELPEEDGGDQIYGAMNAAMRNNNAQGPARIPYSVCARWCTGGANPRRATELTKCAPLFTDPQRPFCCPPSHPPTPK